MCATSQPHLNDFVARSTNENLSLLFSTSNVLLAFTAESLSNASSTTINALLKLWINITRLDQTTGGIFLPNKTLVSRLGILQPHSFLFKPEGKEIHELIIAKLVFKGLIITSWRHSPQLNNLFNSVDLNPFNVQNDILKLFYIVTLQLATPK